MNVFPSPEIEDVTNMEVPLSSVPFGFINKVLYIKVLKTSCWCAFSVKFFSCSFLNKGISNSIGISFVTAVISLLSKIFEFNKNSKYIITKGVTTPMIKAIK